MEENLGLSNWVSTQRQEYKLLQKGIPSRLNKDRIQLLEDVGFVWEAKRGYPGPSSQAPAQSKIDSTVSRGKNKKEEKLKQCTTSDETKHVAMKQPQRYMTPTTHNSRSSFQASANIKADNQLSMPSSSNNTFFSGRTTSQDLQQPIKNFIPRQQQGMMNLCPTGISAFAGAPCNSYQVPMEQNPGMFMPSVAQQMNSQFMAFPNAVAPQRNNDLFVMNQSNPCISRFICTPNERVPDQKVMSMYQNKNNKGDNQVASKLHDCPVDGLTTKSSKSSDILKNTKYSELFL